MTKVRRHLHRTFHSLVHARNFRLFFIGQLVSVTGTWMQMVATAWLVLQLTGSGVALGIETALAFGPMIVLGPWAGTMADRRDKRRILIGTQISFGVLALALWALVATGAATLTVVYVLAFLQGIATAIDMPSRQSFYAEMVGPGDVANAISLNSAVMTGTRIVGPAFAGLAIGSVGLAACFLINGLSYVAVIGALLAMRPDELHRLPTEGSSRGRIREGLRYVWTTPELRNPIALMAVLYTFSFNFSVLLPLVAQDTFGGDAGTLGVLFSFMGVGSLIGALAMANRAAPTPHGLAVMSTAFGGVCLAIALAPTLPLELAALVVVGFVSIVFMITANSLLQLTSRPDMRGRVMAIYGVVFLGGTPIGGPIAGFVGQHFGPRVGVALGAAVAVAAGSVALRAFGGRRADAVDLAVAEEPALAA